MPGEASLGQISEYVYAFWESRIFLTAVELKVFSAIGDEAKTPEQVASGLDLDLRATDILLHALASMGLLETHGARFRNTDVTARHLVEGKPEYMGTGFMHSANLWRRWSSLTQVMRTGQPVDVAVPGDSGDWTESFIMAMHGRAVTRAPKVADALDLSGVSRVLDLGGGPGTHALVFAQRQSDLQAVVFDLPSVVPITRRIISDYGLSERVTTLSGDYLVDDYGSGYDMVFLSAIIHSNSPEQNKLIFRKAWESLYPGGKIAVVDFILNDDKTDPRFGAVFAVNMLVGTQNGNSYSRSEIRSWLEDTGYVEITDPVDVDEDIALMLGTKPAR